MGFAVVVGAFVSALAAIVRDDFVLAFIFVLVFIVPARGLLQGLYNTSKLTGMCRDRTPTADSIFRHAIRWSGSIQLNPEQLASAGYSTTGEERLGHDRLLAYLNVASTG